MKITILAPIEIDVDDILCSRKCDYETPSNYCELFGENCETNDYTIDEGPIFERCKSCLNSKIIEQLLSH